MAPSSGADPRSTAGSSRAGGCFCRKNAATRFEELNQDDLVAKLGPRFSRDGFINSGEFDEYSR